MRYFYISFRCKIAWFITSTRNDCLTISSFLLFELYAFLMLSETNIFLKSSENYFCSLHLTMKLISIDATGIKRSCCLCRSYGFIFFTASNRVHCLRKILTKHFLSSIFLSVMPINTFHKSVVSIGIIVEPRGNREGESNKSRISCKDTSKKQHKMFSLRFITFIS